MRRTKPTPTYRPLLRDALRITWSHKSLWVFGLFAAILSSGGVLETTWRSARHVGTGATLTESWLNGSLIGYETFGSWMEQLQAAGSSQVVLLVTTVVGLLALAMIASLLAQGALARGVLSEEEPGVRASLAHGGFHAFDVFLLNVFAKGALVFLMLLTTAPLVLLNTQTFGGETLLYAAVLAIFLPAVIAVNTIFMIALMVVVRENEHALSAIGIAARAFWAHWLAALEFGLIQFLLVFLALFAGLTALLVLLVPFSLLLLLSLLAATPILFVFTYLLGTLVAFTLLFAAVGGTTVFQYASWAAFYERSLHRAGRTPLKPKVMRLWAK